MATTSYNCPCERSSLIIPKVAGLYEVDEINSLKAQMVSLTNVLSKLITGGQAQASPPSIASLVALASKMSTQKELEQGDNETTNYVDRGHYRGHQQQ